MDKNINEVISNGKSISKLTNELENELFGEMNYISEESVDFLNKYLNEISEDTGVNLFD